ncbi:MAG: hypothetical protein PHD82_13565 [Candidatus Riflebacteria bacterium]|nr:hypothetical protein [Candidatus Riflebacteria bacterium]
MTNKNAMLGHFCRQCHTAVTSNAAVCPLCGLSRPVFEKLNPLEKEYLANPPLVPPKFHHLCETINPNSSLAGNMLTEFGKYLGNPGQSWLLIVALLALILGGGMMALHLLFPLSFMLFWAGMVFTAYDMVQFSRAAAVSLLVRRLQMRGGSSPYSVHFRIEEQLTQMFSSLQLILNSFFDKNWSGPAIEMQAAAESFLQAVKTVTARIQKFAQLSLETASIIWRNNVYAIVADPQTTYQEKVVAIANKIREAEALIMRFRWMMNLGNIHNIMVNHVSGTSTGNAGEDRRAAITETFLGPHGPMTEAYYGNFEHVPFEIPFKMRFFWHQQLPPHPLPAEDIATELPQTRELFESIEQVRKLKGKLEEQMILDCTANAVSNASGQETTALEARDLQRFQLYSQYLDIPKFQPDSDELQDRVDRLRAQIKI